ncbi:MAG: FprA family A-type flavoprotein [Lachnospiraceae bacterium]|nr:FprA family A-type flavoprotein [Lachnospiraceae bacterium]
MEQINLTGQIRWIGKVDDRKVPFHRLILEKGTTYNSYFIDAEKPAVIDTVDILFGKEYVENLSKMTDLTKLEYIIINHVEPDHSGALPALAAKASKAVIVCTKLAEDELKKMFRLYNREFLIVKDGDQLELGGVTLEFIETPYLHTAETMMTYAKEDQILFSCDIFSTHIANFELFNDIAKQEYTEDFRVYYDLIMAPHRPYVRDMLKKIEQLPIKMIAPSHGYILRGDPQKFITIYNQKSELNLSGKERRVVIAYATMTGNTGKVAALLSKQLTDAGIEVSVFHLKDADLGEVADRIKESNGFLIGSATRYGDMVGNVEELLKMIQAEDVAGKPAAAFGSYGWSGEAIAHVEDYLVQFGAKVVNQKFLIQNMGVEEAIFPLRIRFSAEEQKERIENAGRIFAEQIMAAK